MKKSIIDFNEKKGFICDMDGVIYHGNQILPGVPEFIQWLHDEKKEYLFLTNNSGYTPRELNQILQNNASPLTDRLACIILLNCYSLTLKASGST